MNIERRYWRWKEEFNSTHYKLRCEIDSLISKGLAKARPESDEFSGVDNAPWRIVVSNGKIVKILFDSKFETLLDVVVWDLDLKDFEKAISKVLSPISKSDKCDKLIVVFRDSFVAIAGIEASSEIGLAAIGKM
ncbi:hypothetical protein BH09BAC3_BH09BAC3_35310 [soil metagenome]